MEKLKLIECVQKAGKLPFKVKVSTKDGGLWPEDAVLEVTKIGVKESGLNAGEVTYDFKNLSTGTNHTSWRHTSSDRFQLVLDTKTPQAILDWIGDDDDEKFGCQTAEVRELVELIYADLKKQA